MPKSDRLVFVECHLAGDNEKENLGHFQPCQYNAGNNNHLAVHAQFIKDKLNGVFFLHLRYDNSNITVTAHIFHLFPAFAANQTKFFHIGTILCEKRA